MTLHETLGISPLSRCVTACGSGGKSSLLLALAREAQRSGRRAVLTTTTHISVSMPEGCALFSGEDPAALEALFQAGLVPVAGEVLRKENRLGAGSAAQRAMLYACADTVYNEGDGSKRLPVKYPDLTREPVIPPETDALLVVCGLSALGKPVNEICHRYALLRQALPDIEGRLTEEMLARILWAGYGRFDPLFVLNQADTPRLRESGERIRELLIRAGAQKAAVLSLKNAGQTLIE